MTADPATLLQTTVDSPLGELLLLGDERALRRLRITDGPREAPADECGRRSEEAFAEARDQLGRYFAGERRGFDLPLAPSGTAFQRRVWAALIEIPYGETISYAELARRTGRPRAVRAVAAANARNPLAIVVPCHRVIGSGGALTGYAGGLERKRLLLDLEAGRAA